MDKLQLMTLVNKAGILTICLTLALAANFVYGQWTEPTALPPNGNVDVPLNTSGNPQIKSGNLGVDSMYAADTVYSDRYCNLFGENCFDPIEVGAAGGVNVNAAEIAINLAGNVATANFPSKYVCYYSGNISVLYFEFVTSSGNVQYRPMGSGLQWWRPNGDYSLSSGINCGSGTVTNIQQLCDLGQCVY